MNDSLSSSQPWSGVQITPMPLSPITAARWDYEPAPTLLERLLPWMEPQDGDASVLARTLWSRYRQTSPTGPETYVADDLVLSVGLHQWALGVTVEQLDTGISSRPSALLQAYLDLGPWRLTLSREWGTA